MRVTQTHTGRLIVGHEPTVYGPVLEVFAPYFHGDHDCMFEVT